jgi:hypothetical protein
MMSFANKEAFEGHEQLTQDLAHAECGAGTESPLGLLPLCRKTSDLNVWVRENW